MRKFLKGFAIMLTALITMPLWLPIAIIAILIDMCFILGGYDPFNTPIRKFIDRF